MTIKAVVLDIGGVLEVIDDGVFPAPFEQRHGLAAGAVSSVGEWPGDPGIGAMSEADVRAHWKHGLGLDDRQADELMRDFWLWYAGTLDRRLFDWFAAQRGPYLTGIVSNSGPGAREAERHHGFEAITDDLIYSHEVGLAKPDRAIYDLAAARLGVLPHEIVFLDDSPACVEGAIAAGWHAARHVDTPTSIRELEAVLGR